MVSYLDTRGQVLTIVRSISDTDHLQYSQMIVALDKFQPMSHSLWLQMDVNSGRDISATIKDMVKEEGKTCVSIIVPTRMYGHDRQGDRIAIKEAVETAKQQIYNEPDYLATIEYLRQQIEYNKNHEGVGIFVSSRIKMLVKFPFPVEKKIVVNKFFQLQDLLYIENYSGIYYLLNISKNEIHLFQGIMNDLEEINNDNFPRKNNDEYEYAKPSAGSSHAGYAHVKAFEKDKSEIEQTRLKKMFREADRCLSEYLTGKTPLVLCGPERDISLYKFVTKHEANIIGAMSDNYRNTQKHDMEQLAWLQVRSYFDRQKLVLIKDLKEKIGTGHAVFGIEPVWAAAREGKGLKLLVEKDYLSNALINVNGSLMHFTATKNEKGPDILNEIITTVIEKNGKVIIIENGGLKDYNKIGLITRY